MGTIAIIITISKIDDQYILDQNRFFSSKVAPHHKIKVTKKYIANQRPTKLPIPFPANRVPLLMNNIAAKLQRLMPAAAT